MNNPKPLAGQVALVAGATRGAGRGVARMLGEAGAIVYCTGRSSRTQPNTSSHHYARRPETIEETAEMVTAAGGRGIAVRVDHAVNPEVAALFERIAREQDGRLDVLVNVITGMPMAETRPLEEGLAYLDGWLRPHLVTAWHAAHLMKPRRRGLLVELVEHDTVGYHGELFFDLMEAGLKRLSLALAHELAPHGVTALSIAPGFMRTEAILEGYGVSEENWRDALDNPDAKTFGWIGSETPCFTGRAIAALAADPLLAAKSGGIYGSWELSREYGFVDVDGRLPDRAAWLLAFDQVMAGFAGVVRPPRDWCIVNRTAHE